MYAKYFSTLVKTSGVPNLNVDQFVRYQNIVALDYYITQIEKQGLTRSFFRDVEGKKSILKRLTKGLAPNDLLIEMIALSED